MSILASTMLCNEFHLVCIRKIRNIMIEFPPPNFSRAHLTGLILPRWGLNIRPEYHPLSLVFTQPSHTPFWDMYKHKTPPSPPQNSPFPDLNLKVGKMNLPVWAIRTPIEQKCLKSGQNFSRSGQENYSWKDR